MVSLHLHSNYLALIVIFQFNPDNNRARGVILCFSSVLQISPIFTLRVVWINNAQIRIKSHRSDFCS